MQIVHETPCVIMQTHIQIYWSLWNTLYHKTRALPGSNILQGYPIYVAGQMCKICRLLQMYTRYVAIVSSYGMKKNGLKKIVKGK